MAAIANSVFMDGCRKPLSSKEMYVRSSSASSAKRSWDRPASFLNSRNTSAKAVLIFTTFRIHRRITFDD